MAPLPELTGAPPVTHRHVAAGDVRLHVAEAGSGPPLLLLHGWPQHWWSWRELIPRLAEEYRVLAVDLRGWGWSDAPPGDYRKTTFASDVHALIEAEELGPVSIIGHDWGGYAAFLLALAHPESVARMVVLDVPPPWAGRPEPRHLALPALLSYQVALATPGLGASLMTRSPRFVRGMIRAGSRLRQWTEEELDIYAAVLREPARAAASSACYRTFLTRELPGMLSRRRPPELKVPTLLAMGGRSAIHRAAGPRPARNLRVEVIDGAGHFLPEEAPVQVLDLALPFLSAAAG